MFTEDCVKEEHCILIMESPGNVQLAGFKDQILDLVNNTI